ncbi:sugar ABC transporter substrate-binding protein [Microbacterium panaciterrae]|uniref:Extracellular solute-binding protein n=1 Tax=Microbacterium panaciterrae TaxID=985759 RepID=A0ABP8PJ86_9MICO
MHSNKILRRGGIVAAVVTVGALALAGCSGGSTPAASTKPTLSGKATTITMTFWGGDARVQSTQKAIDAFEKKYPNITVKPQFTDWTGYWDQLATATAGGDMPDVVQMDELYLASYGNRGALYNLNNVNIDMSNVAAAARDTGKVDGTQYAEPIGVAVYAIVANKDLFDKYGVALPDDKTWTWDDYAKTAEELSQKSSGAIKGTDQVGGFDAGSVKYWARSDGGEVFDAKGKVVLDPKSLAKMWQYQLDLQKSGGMLSPSAITESFNAGISGNDLATNKVAMGVAYNTQLTALQKSSGQKLVLLQPPVPKNVHPNSYKPSMYWSISAKTKHPAEAAAFVDFLLNDQEAAKALLTERGVPANDKTRALIKDSLAPTDQAAIAYQEAVTPGKAPVVTPNGASTIETILQRYTQQVFAGQQKPLDAAKAFIAELQGEIDAAQ